MLSLVTAISNDFADFERVIFEKGFTTLKGLYFNYTVATADVRNALKQKILLSNYVRVFIDTDELSMYVADTSLLLRHKCTGNCLDGPLYLTVRNSTALVVLC